MTRALAWFSQLVYGDGCPQCGHAGSRGEIVIRGRFRSIRTVCPDTFHDRFRRQSKP